MEDNTRRNLKTAFGYAIVLVLGMFLGLKFVRTNGGSNNSLFNLSSQRTEKVSNILKLIEDNYVDSIKVDSLQNVAINQVLQDLDPHSAYLPPVKAKELKETLEGNFDGIGIEYFIANDTLIVTGITYAGPAYKAGLQKGDKIIYIDKEQVSGKRLPQDKMVGRIRGKRGTAVALSIIRQKEHDIRKLDVIRDKIIISSIDIAYMMDTETGYIKISKFGANTVDDFIKATNQLKGKGMQKLVLDLRGNGGGYLSAATSLADQFLSDKKLIVYTKGAHEPRTDYFATAEGVFEKGKLAVLIDENTASASEIVAGAIQDLDRGTIIGRRSFGKGLVQAQFAFGDGSALNLTIARYYTPSGRSIQKSYQNGYSAYQHELDDRYNKGELTAEKDTLVNKKLLFKTSSGRMVYGGGAIMPDIFVKLDTSAYTTYFNDVIFKGALGNYLYGVLLPTHAEISKMSLDTFLKQEVITNATYAHFVTYAATKKITAEPLIVEKSKVLIKEQLKALIAKFFWGTEAYYKVLNAEDKVIEKSFEAMK